MDPRSTSRRGFLRLALAAPIAGSALAACGTAGPGQAAPGGASYWYITGQPGEGIRANAVARFNEANPDTPIQETSFQNDAYKTRIRTAVGANQAPTLIWGWGGGTLRSYVQAGQVEDLTDFLDGDAALRDRLLPTAFGPATIDGRVYAMPAETVAPIVMFYNRRVFDQVGVTPPQTWEETLALIPQFNAAGIAPFSLAGQSRWTNMMWLEFMYDRIAGPEIFAAAEAGEPDAWSAPGSIEALTQIQDLVNAGAFVNGFSSIAADANADQALLYTDRAAMMLHGSWTYGSMLNDGGDFVPGGNLGFMNFPPIEGSSADQNGTVGNPGQYLSISAQATEEEKEVARNFLATQVLAEPEVAEWLEAGQVPVVQGADAQLAGGENEEFLRFVYDVASTSTSFTQSWDQALSPTAAEALLDNIAQLFQLTVSPQQFADNMNAVSGA